MATGLVGAVYKLKYFIFCQQKSTGKMARAQGKDRENTGNLVLIGAWQPCNRSMLVIRSSPVLNQTLDFNKYFPCFVWHFVFQTKRCHLG